MEYRLIGKTGLNVSCLALGTDNFADPTPEKEAAIILEASIDAGINLVDTGDVYADGEGEKIIGRTLKKSKKRDSVLIATKVASSIGTELVNVGATVSPVVKDKDVVSLIPT